MTALAIQSAVIFLAVLITSLIHHLLANQHGKKSEQMDHRPRVQSPLHWLYHGIHRTQLVAHSAQPVSDGDLVGDIGPV